MSNSGSSSAVGVPLGIATIVPSGNVAMTLSFAFSSKSWSLSNLSWILLSFTCSASSVVAIASTRFFALLALASAFLSASCFSANVVWALAKLIGAST